MGANNSFLPVSERNPVLPLIPGGLGVFQSNVFELFKAKSSSRARFQFFRLAQGEGWRNTMNRQA
jgi:hypothetical protein